MFSRGWPGAVPMVVSSLEITNFRNLRQATLACASRLNLIVGENASGKTSLLEALYFLGRSRSFRTRQIRDLIHDGASTFRIVAWMFDEAGSRRVPVGLEHDARETNVRIDGAPAATLAELASCVPVLLLNPDSHRLLDGGPRQRRRFMDWGAFHMDSVFWSVWKRYVAALRHRNAALKAQSADRSINAWDGELARSAAALDRLRQNFCALLTQTLEPPVEALLGETAVEVEYRRGWHRERDLLDALHAARHQDRSYGFTRFGPHRADFSIRLGAKSAQSLSRGQQKLLIVALMVAQAQLYRLQREDSCILLIDDLPAELDRSNRAKVIRCLAQAEGQIFVTTIDRELVDTTAWNDAQIFRLHSGGINCDALK